MNRDTLLGGIRDYYEAKLRAHGATPAGVDWNSAASQALRFEQLAHLWKADRGASILDYGCGYAALAVWLRQRGHTGHYRGFDVSPAMVGAAAAGAGALRDVHLTADRSALDPCDYAVASGIFNVRRDVPDARWREYVLTTIDDLARLGRRGFAFNALTRYADAEKQRADLHYADPGELFDYCVRTKSRFVALLHESALYEFTVIVRYEPWPTS